MPNVATLLAVSLNLIYIGLMLLGQRFDRNFWPLPQRGSIIPGTNQRFMYAEDFLVMTWGDMIALSLIGSSFAQLAAKGQISLMQYCILAVIASIDAIAFAQICLAPNHKPDQGYPKSGCISVNGALHLPYHGIFVGICVICLYHLIWTGLMRGAPMWFGLIGGALYVAAFFCDLRAGHFDPIKPL